MILKQVKIENIRSYVSETITFEEGSTLLSGDIGSGKSTILLAIEFALFGVAKGMLSGETLLRFGAKEGAVELSFDLLEQKKRREATVRRTLKKTKHAVAQTAGYLILDGEKTELTPVELRSKVLDLLGYPETLLTKNKSLIFRYSVYTPQEDMKQIILEDKEQRLITLRQIFNIDKYKRIIENSQLYLKHLREQKRFFEGRASSLNEREEEKKLYEGKRKELLHKRAAHAEKYETAKREFDSASTSLHVLDQEKKKRQKLEKEIAVAESVLKQSSARIKEYEEALHTLEKERSLLMKKNEEMEEERKDRNVDELKQKILELEKKKHALEKDIQHSEKNSSIFHEKVREAQHLISQIKELDSCPLCRQKVAHTHKQRVSSTENEKIAKYSKALEETEVLLERMKDEKKTLEKELKALEKQMQESVLEQQRMKNLAEKITDRQQTIKKYADAKKRAEEELLAKKEVLDGQKKELSSFAFDDERYAQLKKGYEAKLQTKHRLEVESASLEKELQSYGMMLEKVDTALRDIHGSLRKVESLNSLLQWFESCFIPLMDTMEKHIMQSLQHSFNDHFSQWFDMLIEDETLKVRIDDDFTPKVQHHGYDIEIEALSGGERTSVALAYRLALNKVISTLIEDIKTKDLLILDEPTDGFSTEQLDRLKEVLETIKARQLLLVSHEQKIESFVDRVIRVRKEGGISRIIG